MEKEFCLTPMFSGASIAPQERAAYRLVIKQWMNETCAGWTSAVFKSHCRECDNYFSVECDDSLYGFRLLDKKDVQVYSIPENGMVFGAIICTCGQTERILSVTFKTKTGFLRTSSGALLTVFGMSSSSSLSDDEVSPRGKGSGRKSRQGSGKKSPKEN